MATATPISALAPYQPPEGLAARDIIAHARDHIDRLQKRHNNLLQVVEQKDGVVDQLKNQLVVGYQRGAKTGIRSVVALGTTSALGLINGRYGGDKGYVAPHSLAVDWTVGGVAHLAGIGASFFLEDEADHELAAKPGGLPRLSEVLHSIGDAGLGVGLYRLTHAKGAELAAAKAAKATGAPAPGPGANGARPAGATYAIPQPQGR